MESFRADHSAVVAAAPVCVDCCREHCRQAPSAAVASVHRSSSESASESDLRRRRRFDCGGRRSRRLFIASSFFVGLILVPCAMSTPVKHPQHQQHRRQASDVSLMPSGPEFWFDPCDTNETWDRQCGAPYADVPDPLDGGSGDGGVAPEMMAPRRTDRQIINGIITLVKAALKYVSPKFNDKSEPTFTELYVKEMFQTSFAEHHKQTKHFEISWLKTADNVNMSMDEPLSKSYKRGLELEKTLQEVYVAMQYLAVGLEQVAWYTNQTKMPFADNFMNVTKNLKTILCEISTDIIEVNETAVGCHVPRTVMPLEARNDTQLHWPILREYILGLQYAHEAFSHLLKKAPR